MKKILVSLLASVLPFIGYTQVKVDANGHVAIGDISTPILMSDGALNVNTSNNKIGAKVAVTSSSANTTSLFCSLHAGGYSNNYSIMSMYDGTANGAALYSTTLTTGYNLTGKYAGFFAGNVKITGTISGTFVGNSDARLKERVTPLADKEVGVLNAIENLTPISFKYKKLKSSQIQTDTIDEKMKIEDENLSGEAMEKEHFGLIAQELQEVYPNLVYEKDNGYLAVNYVELVPVLMQAIKELNAKVAMLEAGKVNLSPHTCGEQETLSLPLNQEQWASSSMDQNVPNPFTDKTDIAIYLPESIQTATLYIYDLSGKQVEQHPVEGRGETVMTIHADKMEAGMYVYSLIADKKVVTTKKMIVVK